MKDEKVCMGCGVRLQSDDETQIGYIPDNHNMIWCQRCFRIRHYNDMTEIVQDAETYQVKLSMIRNQEALVVQIVDLFDFGGSFIPELHRYIGKNRLILIVNKIDLFPRSTNWQRVTDWIRDAYRQEQLFPEAILLTSAEKGFQVRETMEAIEYYRQGRDVYMVGTANVGKSTLINRMLQAASVDGSDLTTSPYPGTTLDFIQIPLDDGRYLVDTPGLLRKDRMTEWLNPAELKLVVPSSRIKPKVYQLQAKQTLFLGGLVRFDFIAGDPQSFVCYTSNRLLIHRTKLAHADQFAKKHIGGLLKPPMNSEHGIKWRKEHLYLPSDKVDIAISGFGFISSGKKKAEVAITVPEQVQLNLRPSII
ncbi:hypothetical protein SAMN05444392_10379 [Seinonella peptonophila]|uniref:CP-type G domain-containing protein n=1 Tax=Seinonella peptonophila TaxID=112248 RepID=A0A1M4W7U6_9BACL|nr:ribosome biogenesis GTPase YqeH [Seinonella peptonophila]SHE77225.1 hypothetical protein SAMN05444392_10379 [Seinonella peptonophila]